MIDGYKEQPSAKDVTHFHHNKKTVLKQINFSKETICIVTKEEFLANPSNKEFEDDLRKFIGSKMSSKVFRRSC